MAAHPIRHDEEVLIIEDRVTVFVVLPPTARVGPADRSHEDELVGTRLLVVVGIHLADDRDLVVGLLRGTFARLGARRFRRLISRPSARSIAASPARFFFFRPPAVIRANAMINRMPPRVMRKSASGGGTFMAASDAANW